jgi:hypothetical protein
MPWATSLNDYYMFNFLTCGTAQNQSPLSFLSERNVKLNLDLDH